MVAPIVIIMDASAYANTHNITDEREEIVTIKKHTERPDLP